MAIISSGVDRGSVISTMTNPLRPARRRGTLGPRKSASIVLRLFDSAAAGRRFRDYGESGKPLQEARQPRGFPCVRAARAMQDSKAVASCNQDITVREQRE